MSNQSSSPEEVKFSPREAAVDDLERLAALEKQIQVAPWTQAAFEAELQKPYSHTLLLTDDETDETVLGYVVYWLMLDDCQILNLGVAQSFRGLGLGKQLVRMVCSQAMKKGIQVVKLDVRKSNLKAIELYQAIGFTISSIRKGFYSNGEDAYQMALQMDGQALDF
ncbi:MAG: ribosomal protein S18-alanine N-acetyltransferase [Bdellovibrionales bacterium]|nr:ribosomal protein S18-alanine N-acetyltransferase [Bdellovibrionales bacterium]